MAYKVECDLVGATPFSFSAPVRTPKEPKEPAAEHEKRVWRERIHRNDAGEAFIPPMALKNCLTECAQYLAEQVEGKGNATYTKHFRAGIIVTDPLMLGIDADDIPGEWLFLSSTGKRGSMAGTRVWKLYPKVDPWRTHATIHVLDPTITHEKMEQYLHDAGEFIGMGRFRPINGGFYGRFRVENVKFVEQS